MELGLITTLLALYRLAITNPSFVQKFETYFYLYINRGPTRPFVPYSCISVALPQFKDIRIPKSESHTILSDRTVLYCTSSHIRTYTFVHSIRSSTCVRAVCWSRFCDPLVSYQFLTFVIIRNLFMKNN